MHHQRCFCAKGGYGGGVEGDPCCHALRLVSVSAAAAPLREEDADGHVRPGFCLCARFGSGIPPSDDRCHLQPSGSLSLVRQPVRVAILHRLFGAAWQSHANVRRGLDSGSAAHGVCKREGITGELHVHYAARPLDIPLPFADPIVRCVSISRGPLKGEGKAGLLQVITKVSHEFLDDAQPIRRLLCRA